MSKLKQLARDLGELCESKRRAYGDSVGKSAEVLRILYPHGLAPDQYLDAITTARIIDKLSRKAQGGDPHGESPYIDVAGHALVALVHQSVEVQDSPCASANGSAAERQSQAPSDSAPKNAAAPTTPTASDASAKSSPEQSSKPSSSASGSTDAPAPTATENASIVADVLQNAVEHNREHRCAQCVGPLPEYRLCFHTLLWTPGNPGARKELSCCSLSCAVVFKGRITAK